VTTLDDIALAAKDILTWVAKQSDTRRGASLAIQDTCNGSLDWFSNVQNPGCRKTILEQRFPKPTPCAVAWGAQFTIPVNQFSNFQLPVAMFGYPVSAPFQLDGVPAPGFANQLGVLYIEWRCGGASHFATVDLSGGALSLPGVDWVRVSLVSQGFQTGGPFPLSGSVDVSILPSSCGGLVARASAQPIESLSSAIWLGGNEFARRWTVTRGPGQNPVGSSAPLVGFPATNLGSGVPTPQQLVTFPELAGYVNGVTSVSQVWIPLVGGRVGYVVFQDQVPLPLPTILSIIEEVQVC